jgi:uncharacterized damage-inducible protein DinB
MDPLRDHLTELLRGGHAHATFKQALDKLPAELRGKKAPRAPYTIWQLLEHMRIAQWDILEFSRNPKHVSPKWPEGYWPDGSSPANEPAWDKSVRSFRRDADAMIELVCDESNDLFAPLPHGTGQTLLREALLLADHNSYHLGQIVVVRRLLGAWSE